MNKYEEKMKKIEDLLSTSNQKELNRLYDFFAELGHVRNTYENQERCCESRFSCAWWRVPPPPSVSLIPRRH